jgi:hypothetical protein
MWTIPQVLAEKQKIISALPDCQSGWLMLAKTLAAQSYPPGMRE